MRVLSGIQPSGQLHIGNYFGMMQPMISNMAEHELYAFIVDLHALTSVHDAQRLATGTLEAAVDFMALGLEPERCIFWVQSDVPEVTELTWVLSTLTPMGLLERCHSYKDKIAKGIASSHGLFAYPVLMAADILLYQAQRVPVGKDQKQHLEVARDIAIKFNSLFGDTFVLPEPVIDADLAVVPGLDGQKMSKSYGNTIPIFTGEKELKKRVMAIVTDSTPVDEPKDPDRCNLYNIFKLFAPADRLKEVRDLYLNGGAMYGKIKLELLELLWEYFRPARQRREQLLADPGQVRDILRQGAEKARAKAAPTLEEVRRRVGLRY
ncbi:tryptophan--tRNA ligase [Desulfurivibrio alkaliphilus]|uniref:Tryptophan--tRNA ligase n=1 Tax=Desulfurivibrio alkaliphilus (strain DSM 19089 / UNIQEM U267 / AHT2) TaxID=589865 RepID=D6Z5B6_DESAT|nr:tryptophan--tRNA ligase [Desulfurivibrio alkaliphilus]ADH84773.1 tryptophanyl-tRNA synthetase [Desulfurivibrio alkaliphilus AHT 2]